jgi:beta-lactamase class A
MLTRTLIAFLRLFSLALFVLSGWLIYRQLGTFESSRSLYPSGITAAGISIGGLTREDAAARLKEAYEFPVELVYHEAVLQILPERFGFNLNLETMLDAADQARKPYRSRDAFFSYLRGEPYTSSLQIPLAYSLLPEGIRNFLLEEIAARYDLNPSEASPYPGLPVYLPGSPGYSLDIESALPLVEQALTSLSDRRVELPIKEHPALPPLFQNLEVHLKQIIELSGYEGLLGLYLQDLDSGKEIHFSFNDGRYISVRPDVSFTASSVIKIPVMISVFSRLEGEGGSQTASQLERMIGHSDNTATDWLVSRVVDPVYGPLLVTEDMRKLGLENTFLAGYFALGSPLLQRFETPANQRQDIQFTLDPYNQTSPSDMGRLLGWIYTCAQDGTGPLIEIYNGKIDRSDCSRMIKLLVLDKIPFLLQAGVPEGTPVAHKHGWVASASTGVIHDISDAALIFTPGGDYVLSVFLYHPRQLLFEPSNLLAASLSRAVYNFFNPPQ